MSRQHHVVKSVCEVFQAVERREKMFEFRLNDRDYKVGDTLTLVEVTPSAVEATGRKQGPFRITYILYGGQSGIPVDHCVMQIQEC